MKITSISLVFMAQLLYVNLIYCEGINEQLMTQFSAPIECTRKGIKTFITNSYNHPLYKDFLSTCMIHIIDLLDFAHKKNNNIFFIYQILNLFMQKIHETPCINPYALLYFLQHSVPLVSEILNAETLSMNKKIEKILEDALINDFNLLKNKPEEFIKKQTQAIINTSKSEMSQYIKVQNAYCHIIELLLSKMFFDLQETSDACECFEKLLITIDYAFKSGVLIDEEALQKTEWALCSRWIYSLQLQNNDLPKSKKKFIKEFTQKRVEKILLSNEIDELIVKKGQFLANHYELMVGDAGFEPTTPSL